MKAVLSPLSSVTVESPEKQMAPVPPPPTSDVPSTDVAPGPLVVMSLAISTAPVDSSSTLTVTV